MLVTGYRVSSLQDVNMLEICGTQGEYPEHRHTVHREMVKMIHFVFRAFDQNKKLKGADKINFNDMYLFNPIYPKCPH